MCLLALINTKSEFSDDDLADFIIKNRDGFGFMCPDGNGAVATEKSIMSSNLDEAKANFVARFRWWRDFAEKAGSEHFAMHTRMRTHGDIDHANAHPHYVHDNVFLMHNGVLSVDTKSDKAASDTVHYIRSTLRPLVEQFKDAPAAVEMPQFLELIADDIGRSNKFILCSPRGFSIVNKDSGTEFRGSWFSNTYAWTIHSPSRNYRWQTGHNLWSEFWGAEDDGAIGAYLQAWQIPGDSPTPPHAKKDVSALLQEARFSVKATYAERLSDVDFHRRFVEDLYYDLSKGAVDLRGRFGLARKVPVSTPESERELNSFLRACRGRCQSQGGRIRFLEQVLSVMKLEIADLDFWYADIEMSLSDESDDVDVVDDETVHTVEVPKETSVVRKVAKKLLRAVSPS